MVIYAGDISSRETNEAMIDLAVKEFDHFDVLINNAGIMDDMSPMADVTDEMYEKVMKVNVYGPMCAMRKASQVFLEQGDGGSIINVASAGAVKACAGAVYAASKAAVNALTRSWAKELGKFGVRVVGIAPGILEATGLRTLSYETALAYTRGITVEQLRAGYSKTGTTPMGRSGKLSEVASAVAFMASEKAGYVHGVTLNVAGGKTRG